VTELLPRVLTSVVLALAGLTTLSFPGCFAAVCPYFARVDLPSPYEDRLDEVLCARKAAENIPMWFGAMLGLISLALAAAAWLPAVSPAIPYAAWCLAFAATTAIACVRFRRATQRRVAALVPRDRRSALPPAVVVAIAACVAVELALVVSSPYRLVWAAVAIASATLLWIAWQLAEAPALILGADVPVECYVDDRLRAVRTINVAGLASAPMLFLLGATHDFSAPGVAAWIVATIAAAVCATYQFRASRSIDPKSALAAMNARA